MQHLTVHSPQFITYKGELFTIDILGGIDLQQLERMICTLRVSFKDYPPIRSTLDLYSDDQTDKLLRTICQKWDLKLLEVSKTVHSFISEIENYKLDRLKFPNQKQVNTFELSDDEVRTARAYLEDKHLIQNLKTDFQNIGILGEDNNALVLFLACASHRYENPFSVLCLAKSGIGKSHLLQKLSACMPASAYTLHTQLSENALYYFDSDQLDGKILFVEDLDWTHEMLLPLSTLQTQRKLIKTRATKNKDGLLHSTTFEVNAKLCLIASAYAEKNYDNMSLPFLCLHLNHSHDQDNLIMNYQRAMMAGQIDKTLIAKTARKLQCVIASLENVTVVNPYALHIHLPENIPSPRKTLLLLLDFINVVTFFHQRQRVQRVNELTGEIYIETTPEDIELAFVLLKRSLLHKADELSAAARNFYNWLQTFLAEAKTKQFTALDIRKMRNVHPRTLNRYLQELNLFHYIQITGGNKHRGGFIYRLTDLNQTATLKNELESCLQRTLEAINVNTAIIKEPKPVEHTTTLAQQTESEKPAFFDKNYKRIRINDKEQHTLKLILELEAKEPEREYLTNDITALSGRSQCMEARYLKTLWEQGKLTREWRNRQYYYRVTPFSRSVSQNPLSNTENPVNTAQ
jgi:hypothetical protein